MEMAEVAASGTVLDALLHELSVQGQGGHPKADRGHLAAYPIKGTIDLLALAEAVESALGGTSSDDEDAKTPAELNAANDG
jgi:hypothetical protein